MKNLFFIVCILTGVSFFGQNEMNLHIQNYTPYQLHYTIGKTNWNSTTCEDDVESRGNSNGSESILKQSSNPGIEATEAFYDYRLYLSNDLNPDFPDTPLIETWLLNTSRLYNPTNPSLYRFPSDAPELDNASKYSDWSVIKFNLYDNTLGVGGGSMQVVNTPCSPIANPTSPNPEFLIFMSPNSPVQGNMFTLGGDKWIIFN